jgi:hypothetical protein
MNQDNEWKLLLFHWNRLNRWQKKRIVWRLRRYKIELQTYLTLLSIIVFVMKLITPLPVRRRVFVPAHWIHERRKS